MARRRFSPSGRMDSLLMLVPFHDSREDIGLLVLIVPLFAVHTTGCVTGSAHLAIAQKPCGSDRGEQDQAENGLKNLNQ
jgi:hypothetical protein